MSPAIRKSPKLSNEHLYVVTMISNPIRFRSRYALYRKFEQHMKASGVTLITVEVALGDRPFIVTDADNPNHVQLRTWSELWHKENALKLGIAHTIQIYPNAEFIAWIDADTSMANQSFETKADEDERGNWATETIHALQHYMVVQLFSEAIDLGPEGEYIHRHKSYMWKYINAPGGAGSGYYDDGHPGYAWAARREALDLTGGLPDYCVLGSADRHFAGALVGQVTNTYNKGVHPNYAAPLLRLQALCERHIRRDVGYVPGTLFHYYHGAKKNRKYQDRWKILVNNQFDPHLDLIRDSQGLWEWTENNLKLRDDLRRYFRERNEDCIFVG